MCDEACECEASACSTSKIYFAHRFACTIFYDLHTKFSSFKANPPNSNHK